MAAVQGKKNAYPGNVEETYPDTFNIKAMPTQTLEKKPGQLPDHMIKQFFEEVSKCRLCRLVLVVVVALWSNDFIRL